jgi:diguanylate cyclase (GGDEF)-like protein
MTFSSLLSLFALALIVEQNFSFSKIENLKGQKEIITSLKNLPKKDVDLAIIQFNGKSTQLFHEIEKLRKLYDYDFTGSYIFDSKQNYFTKLDRLEEFTKKFNGTAIAYYTSEEEDEEETFEALSNGFIAINSFIDSLIIDDIHSNQEKSNLLQTILIALFVILFIFTLWYKKRLRQIDQDILYLYSVESNKKEYVTFSEEADAIALRMKRKPTIADNPSMLDPLTEINNLKGLFATYAEKKGMKDGSFTSVTVLEVDNFSKSRRPFSQEMTQMILKKIAFTLSLHEQPTDVIARTDYNQFIIVLSRISKEKSFKDIELIRQSISELQFKVQDKGAVIITLSGGFIIKPNNVSLEEAIKQSKELLAYAQSTGKSMLAQRKDLAEHDLQPANK